MGKVVDRNGGIHGWRGRFAGHARNEAEPDLLSPEPAAAPTRPVRLEPGCQVECVNLNSPTREVGTLLTAVYEDTYMVGDLRRADGTTYRNEGRWKRLAQTP